MGAGEGAGGRCCPYGATLFRQALRPATFPRGEGLILQTTIYTYTWLPIPWQPFFVFFHVMLAFFYTQ